MYFLIWKNRVVNATSIYNEGYNQPLTLWTMPVKTGIDDVEAEKADLCLFVDDRFWKVGCSQLNTPLFVGKHSTTENLTVVPWGLGEMDLYALPLGMRLSQSVSRAIDLNEYFNSEIFPNYQ